MADCRYNGADAAEVLHVDPSTITRWLKGRGTPSVKKVDELAQLMDVPAKDLVLAIFTTSKADPLTRVEQLLEAVLARMDGVEVRQAELEARLDAEPPKRSGRQPRRDG